MTEFENKLEEIVYCAVAQSNGVHDIVDDRDVIGYMSSIKKLINDELIGEDEVGCYSDYDVVVGANSLREEQRKKIGRL